MAEGFNPFGDLDMSSMLLGLAFAQSPVLKPLAPMIFQQSLQAGKNRRSASLVKGLGEVHQLMQAGDFAGATERLGSIEATPGSESVIQGVLNNITKMQQHQQVGQLIGQLGQVNTLPMEQRQQALTQIMSGLSKTGDLSGVTGMANTLLPNQEIKADTGAGVITSINPRTSEVSQQQIVPTTGPEQMGKFTEGLARMGVSPQLWLALSNSPKPEDKARAAEIAQQAMGTQDTAALKQQQGMTNIQVAGQMKAQSHGAAVQGAEQRRTFQFQELHRLPPEELRMYAKAAGVNPDQPVGQWTPEQAQLVLGSRQADETAKQAMQGYAAAKAQVEAKPLPEGTQKRIEALRSLKRNILTVEANFSDKFVGKGFQGEPGVIAGEIRDITGRATDQEVIFRRSLNDVADMLLRARSGAQINEQEYGRLTKLLPRLSDEPTVFKAALQRVVHDIEASVKDAATLAMTEKGALDINQLLDVGPIQKYTPPPLTTSTGKKVIVK